MQPAAAAQPLALDQARHYIQRLLSIINERNAQVEMLKTHLDQKTELCKLHEDRAQRAEANATAAREQLLLQKQLHPPAVPGLTPADLAALNTLPPAERDAMWLRRVFVRGDHKGADAPLGPFELAGIYLDAFSWAGTAATGTDIVAAVARVFPGVRLVRTECGPRFRGLVRAQVAPAGPQEAQARQLRTERTAAALDAYASAAEASSSSRPASPRPPPPPTPKRKRSPEPEPDAPTSKRVRTAQGGAVKADDLLDVRILHDSTIPQRARTDDARICAFEKPARAVVNIGTQTIAVCKTYADAEIQARDTRPALQPHPKVSIGAPTIGLRKTYAEAEVQACGTRPQRQTYAEAGVQACDPGPQVAERPPDRDALLADLEKLPPTDIPPDLPPLRVPRDIVQSALPDLAVRIVQQLRCGEHGRDENVETFRDDGDGGALEYLGTYVLRQVCVGYSRAVHEALVRAVLDEEVRVLSRLGVGDSDSECEDGLVGLSDGD